MFSRRSNPTRDRIEWQPVGAWSTSGLFGTRIRHFIFVYDGTAGISFCTAYAMKVDTMVFEVLIEMKKCRLCLQKATHNEGRGP